LEHLNSTTIGFPAAAMARDPNILAPVTAHEFFHAWNVKRIRPVELGPFDYTRPVRTVNLWWSEGVTDYYADLILLRAGLDSLPGFAQSMAGSIASYRRNPGRRTISPERSSWTAWDPPAANGGLNISYYLQGQLLGFLLDVTIRDSTDNARSLDDVIRYLFDHYAGARGFTRDDLLSSVRAATGLDLTSFFAQFVSGTAEIPWNDFLARAGWRVDFDSASAVDTRIGAISPAVQGGRPRFIVLPGSAAARAGLLSGDEPASDMFGVFSALRGLTPGQTVTLEVLRDGRPVKVVFRADTYTEITARLADLPALTEKMRRIRAGLAGR
jgi:predicted metalloprotease with PDZ domain